MFFVVVLSNGTVVDFVRLHQRTSIPHTRRYAPTPTLRPFWSRLCRAVSFVAFRRTCSRTRLVLPQHLTFFGVFWVETTKYCD